MALDMTQFDGFMEKLETVLSNRDNTELSYVFTRDWQQVSDTLSENCPLFYNQLLPVIQAVLES